jgi:dephospho-CoA kinase
VTCDPDVQLERLVGRGSARDDAAERIAAQGDLATRLRSAATHVIVTSGSRADTQSQALERLDAALATF